MDRLDVPRSVNKREEAQSLLMEDEGVIHSREAARHQAPCSARDRYQAAVAAVLRDLRLSVVLSLRFLVAFGELERQSLLVRHHGACDEPVDLLSRPPRWPRLRGPC